MQNLLKKDKIRRYFVIHAGKRGNLQRFFWPSENWAKLVDFLHEKYHLPIILTGSSLEKELNEGIIQLVKSAKVYNFCEKTTLAQWAFLIKNAEALICLNTGASHLASAFRTRAVVINEEFPELWHPWIPEGKYRILLNPKVEEAEREIEAFLK